MNWVEQGIVPDAAVRAGIRRLLKRRLDELPLQDCEAATQAAQRFVDMMDAAEVALLPEKANEQHYEVPATFFTQVLGPYRKYSCCYWGPNEQSLEQAERAALRISCEHAELEDGMDVLDLGCGWGSLTLWMAEHFPSSHITAVSNSHSQRWFIMDELKTRGFDHVEVITADMNDFTTERQFDRIVSVEMFEHMRNYRRLYERIHGWLRPGGRFFKHIFCHRAIPYAFIDQGPSDWMARHFFSGGIMPSDDLPLYFQDRLKLVKRWRWSGQHYEKTLNAWLDQMDQSKPAIWPVLTQTYDEDAAIWWMRWRLFFMACAEQFAYDHGQQWWVSHYLFEK
ncbi:SAM-dependent methyltransferase [Candidatus Entotheonella serta]|nr:SAM-dependent methyltransferase [Candidatus Entotheonella serta]